MRPSIISLGGVLLVCAWSSAAFAQSSGLPSSYSSSDSASGPSNSADESRDSGLGLEWLWFNADGGYSYASMDSLNSSTFALQNTSSSGPAVAVGGGVRLLFFTLGLRARGLLLSDFNLVELDGEAGFHIKIGQVDQYFGLRGGYAFAGTLSPNTVSAAAMAMGAPPDVSVHGVNVGGTLGFDYYFGHFVSLGLDVNPEFLFLQRPPAPIPSQVNLLPEPARTIAIQNLQAQPLYKESGSSIGFAFAGTAHAGLHF
jgi:hypothetical protein